MISPLYNRHLTPLMCKYIEFVVKTQIHPSRMTKCTIQYLVVCFVTCVDNVAVQIWTATKCNCVSCICRPKILQVLKQKEIAFRTK